MLGVLTWAAMVGCQVFVDDADKQVSRLIEQREQQAIGRQSGAAIDNEVVPQQVPRTAYDHVPSTTQSAIPPEMRVTSAPTPRHLTPPTTQAIMNPASQPGPVNRLDLPSGLVYAFRNSRECQVAKEDLYLSALALTLERHLWSPRFVAGLKTDYANYGEIRDFDHAMAAVSQVAVQQRLPYGGEVTARVIDTLMAAKSPPRRAVRPFWKATFRYCEAPGG